jgi:hypothetical protein
MGSLKNEVGAGLAVGPDFSLRRSYFRTIL